MDRLENGLRQMLLDSVKPSEQGGRLDRWNDAIANFGKEIDVINGILERTTRQERFIYDLVSNEFIEVEETHKQAHTPELLIATWRVRQYKTIKEKVFTGEPETEQMAYISQKLWTKFYKDSKQGPQQPATESLLKFFGKIRQGEMKNIEEKRIARERKEQRNDSRLADRALAVVPRGPTIAPRIAVDLSENLVRENPQFIQNFPELSHYFANPAISRRERYAALAQGIVNFRRAAATVEQEQYALAHRVVHHQFNLMEFLQELDQRIKQLEMIAKGAEDLDRLINQLFQDRKQDRDLAAQNRAQDRAEAAQNRNEDRQQAEHARAQDKAQADAARANDKAEADAARAKDKAEADAARAKDKAEADAARAQDKAQADAARANVKAQADKEIEQLRAEFQSLRESHLESLKEELGLLRAQRDRFQTQLEGIKERHDPLVISSSSLAIIGTGIGFPSTGIVSAFAYAAANHGCGLGLLGGCPLFPLASSVSLIGIAVLGGGALLSSAILLGVMAGESKRAKNLERKLEKQKEKLDKVQLKIDRLSQQNLVQDPKKIANAPPVYIRTLKTKADGSCGFHALLGKPVEGVLQCPNIVEIRQQFCNWLQEKKNQNNLPDTIKIVLTDLFRFPEKHSETFHPKVAQYHEGYDQLNAEEKNNRTQTFIDNIFEDYLVELAKTGTYLLQEELAALAECFDIKVILHQWGWGADSGELRCNELNPNGKTVVSVWYNGINHYERAEINK